MSEQPNAIPLAKMSDVRATITPGPWVLDGPDNRHVVDRAYHVIEGGNGLMPKGFRVSGIISIDDARLISAAPDMLAALQKIDADWAETFPDGPDGNRDWHGLGKLSDETADVWRSIRAAIAKAATP
jgi:hypothetical protein